MAINCQLKGIITELPILWESLVFENLIKGMELKGINQVWVSDITYYRIGERFYYLTFILDLYSRYIVGHAVSESLFTEQTTIPALNMALTL